MPQTLYPSPLRKLLITASIMSTTLIVTIDATIAVVAVPHMQASLAASPDQVVWVLTSYLVASAIMMPLSGWLASRFGRKRVMTISVIAFTLASLGCGVARGLEFMVFARIIQGMGGAGLIPLGQATLLDINPPSKQPQAMALAGLGAMLGPLFGPTLGGWLTDNYTWRWVFLINIPIGVIAALLTAGAHIEVRDKLIGKFDFIGFAAVSLFIGAFQLVLDRGQQNDWFDSLETWVEAGLTLFALYILLVHMLTKRDTFVRAALFADRNFALGCVISAVIGVVIFASSPILTIVTQNLLGYTPLQNGMVSIPRALGTTSTLILMNRIITRFDPRVLVSIGLVCSAISYWVFAGMSLETDRLPILLAGLFQGVSGGLMIAPLSALTFSTLKPQFRNEGTAIYALTRNLGNSLGISAIQVILVRESAQVASRLSEGVRPDSPSLQFARPDMDFDSTPALFRTAGEMWRQASMVAATDIFWMAFMVSICALPVVAMMRRQKLGVAAPVPVDAGH